MMYSTGFWACTNFQPILTLAEFDRFCNIQHFPAFNSWCLEPHSRKCRISSVSEFCRTQFWCYMATAEFVTKLTISAVGNSHPFLFLPNSSKLTNLAISNFGAIWLLRNFSKLPNIAVWNFSSFWTAEFVKVNKFAVPYFDPISTCAVLDAIFTYSRIRQSWSIVQVTILTLPEHVPI